MSELLLIANPSASAFTGGRYRQVLTILSESFDVTPLWPPGPSDARRLVAEAIAAKPPALAVAFGGDGVVHQVANAVAGTPVGLGIIPAGTTNVLARILGIPTRYRAAAEFLAGRPLPKAVPTAWLRGETEHGEPVDETATFSVGMGYDAEVVEYAEREPYRKLRFGGVHYARSAAWVLFKHFRRRPAHIRVVSGAGRADGVAVMAQVHQPYTYFGLLPLGFSSRRPSGALSVATFERITMRRAPGIVLRAVRGRRVERIPGVQIWHDCPAFTIEADPPAWTQADGELIARITQAEVRYASDRLLAAVPDR